MYIKDFDSWNNLKKNIDKSESKVSAKVRDLWWCHIGINIGSEQDGKGVDFERPVLILKKLSSTTYLIAPTTSKFKENYFRVKVETGDKFSYLIIDQIKVIDSKRLKRKLGVVSVENFKVVKEKVSKILKL